MTCGPASFLPFTYVPLVLFRSRTMILPSFTTILVCFLETFPFGRQMSFSSARPTVISSTSKSRRWVGPPFSVRMMLKLMVEAPPRPRSLDEVLSASKGPPAGRHIWSKNQDRQRGRLGSVGAFCGGSQTEELVGSSSDSPALPISRAPCECFLPVLSSVEDAEGDGGGGVLVELAGVLDQLLHPVRDGRSEPRSDVDGELRLAVDELPALEELAQDRDVPEQRHLGDFLRLVVVEQSGKDDGFPVLHGHVRLHLP